MEDHANLQSSDRKAVEYENPAWSFVIFFAALVTTILMAPWLDKIYPEFVIWIKGMIR